MIFTQENINKVSKNKKTFPVLEYKLRKSTNMVEIKTF